MSDFKGKVVLITGSARGIGKAIAERFGKLGARVIVNYSSSEKPAQDTVAEIERLGGEAIAVKADVSKLADIERLFATAIERFGHLDIVIANAGIEQVDQPIADVTEADFDKLYCRLKDWRRFATRYDKLARNYLAAVQLTALRASYLVESTP